MLEGELDLVANDGVAFAEDMSALGVAEDGPVDASVVKHLGGSLACVGAVLVLGDVLGSYLDAGGQSLLGGEEVEGGGGDDDFDFRLVELGLVQDGLGEVLGELESAVLFPVASNE